MVALISWVALTVVGRTSIHAIRRTYALLLLLGAAPAAVFGSTILLLAIVSLCGAFLGALVSVLLSFWIVPAFNAMISPTARLPEYALTAWAPVVAIVASVLTALVSGLSPAFHASRVRPGAVLRTPDGLGREPASGLRILCGAFFLIVASGLVASAGFAGPLGVTGPGPMFNLAVTAGSSALMAVHLLCPQLMSFILWALSSLFSRMGLVVPALGTRSAASRVGTSATTIAPLAVGLGDIGLLLCAVNSVIAFTDALQPGTRADLTDVWMMVAVVAITMLAISAAVVALSARGREREIALLQAAGMRGRHVGALIAAESFAMSLAASIAAAVPVMAGGLVCALASRATLTSGSSVVVWPVSVMLWGLIASWGAEPQELSLSAVSPALVTFACSGEPANFNQISKQTVDQPGPSPLYLLPKSTQEKKIFRVVSGASCRSEETLRVLVGGHVNLHVNLRLLPLNGHVGIKIQGQVLHLISVLLHYQGEQEVTVRQIFDTAAGPSFVDDIDQSPMRGNQLKNVVSTLFFYAHLFRIFCTHLH